MLKRQEFLRSRGTVVEPDRKLDGKLVHSVLNTALVDVDMSASIRLLIDPETKLIRQIQEFYRYSAQDLARIDNEEPAIALGRRENVDRLEYPDRGCSGRPISLPASSGLYSGR